MRTLLGFVLVAAPLACGAHYRPPAAHTHDARFGFLGGTGPAPSVAVACSRWSTSIGDRDPYALSHTSFPETDVQAACFTRVVHEGRATMVGRTPDGCAVPSPDERRSMLALAEELAGPAPASMESSLFACDLSPAQRRAARLHNAKVLRAAASEPGNFPYSAVVALGYGEAGQADTSVVDWLPGDACHAPTSNDLARFGRMVGRTERAADALAAGVAPLAIVTGGAAHSRLIEAFAMLYLLECVHGVPAGRVLVEPCADHTHTNLRNSARWIVAMGARTAYVVTDDDLQADYFQEGGLLSMMGAGLDQRSLRDFGYVLGSWRQASVGAEGGFWFTPFRFWAEPLHGAGSLTCEGL